MPSIDGLISGLSTSDMISQLMKIEAMPQAALKSKVSVQSKAVTAYQSVNSRFSSLLSAARAITSADAWGSIKATASSDAVAVSAQPGAAVGSLSFTVDRLAAAHTITFTGQTVSSLTDAAGSPVLTANTVDVLLEDGTTTTITPADASLQAVVDAINGTADVAYRAAAIQISPGNYTLQLTALKTGDDTAFAVGAPGDYTPVGLNLGAGKVTTAGADAAITIGTDPATQFQVTSTTNTFANVLDGLTITVAKTQTGTPVTVTTASDADGIAAKVQALVDNINTVLNEIGSQTRTKSNELAAGPLVGDSALRKLSQDLLSAVSGGAGNLGSLESVGISVDRYGKVSFDKQDFLDALADDPAKTRSYFDSYTNVAHASATDAFQPGWDTAAGIGRKLEAIAAIASEGVILPTDPADKPREGVLTGLIKRRNEQISDLNDQVAQWDVRLERRRAGLERQWSALEVALGKLQSQSSWLAGQLAGLPSYSS